MTGRIVPLSGVIQHRTFRGVRAVEFVADHTLVRGCVFIMARGLSPQSPGLIRNRRRRRNCRLVDCVFREPLG